MTPDLIVLILMGLLGLLLLIVFFYTLKFGLIWLRGYVTNAPITLLQLIALQLRKVPARRIVDTRINLVKAGIDVSVDDLSVHYLAGGNIINVAAGMIKAKEKNIDLSFDQACALDLKDKGLLEED